MDKLVKKHKNIGRFVAFLGILPGGWFVLARYTQLGERLNIGCGYWMLALVLLTAIWVAYAIFTKILLKDLSLAQEHAHSMLEQRNYKFAHLTTIVEAIIAILIFALSLIGFLITDFTCYLQSAGV